MQIELGEKSFELVYLRAQDCQKYSKILSPIGWKHLIPIIKFPFECDNLSAYYIRKVRDKCFEKSALGPPKNYKQHKHIAICGIVPVEAHFKPTPQHFSWNIAINDCC